MNAYYNKFDREWIKGIGLINTFYWNDIPLFSVITKNLRESYEVNDIIIDYYGILKNNKGFITR